GRASVEHLCVAGLIARAVVEEILHLRLRLSLGFERASSVEALSARDRGHDGGQVSELLGLDGDELIAGLRGLERASGALAGCYQCVDLGARRIEVLYDAGLNTHRVLESGAGILPARLRVGEKLLRGCSARIGQWILLRE